MSNAVDIIVSQAPLSKLNPLPMKDASGLGGTTNTSNTTAVTGEFSAIQVISDAVFSSLTEPGATGSLTGITISAGVTLFGRFTGYQLTSGVVRAYV